MVIIDGDAQCDHPIGHSWLWYRDGSLFDGQPNEWHCVRCPATARYVADPLEEGEEIERVPRPRF